MRELLGRLLEARTALDDKLREESKTSLPYTEHRTILHLWAARYHLWKATMLVIGTQDKSPTPSKED